MGKQVSSWARYTLSAAAGAVAVLVSTVVWLSDVRHNAETALSATVNHEPRIVELEKKVATGEARWESIIRSLERIEAKLDQRK